MWAGQANLKAGANVSPASRSANRPNVIASEAKQSRADLARNIEIASSLRSSQRQLRMLDELRVQPLRDRLPDRLWRLHGGHHPDMTEGRAQHRRVGDCGGERIGR